MTGEGVGAQAVIQQRDGRPVPYTLTGVVGIFFCTVQDAQRAGLEPAPTVGDGVQLPP